MSRAYSRVAHVWCSNLSRSLGPLSEGEWRCCTIGLVCAVVALVWLLGIKPFFVQIAAFAAEQSALRQSEGRRIELERARHGGALERREVVLDARIGPRRGASPVESSRVLGAIYSVATDVGLELKGLVQDHQCVFIDRSVSAGYRVTARGKYRTIVAFSSLVLTVPDSLVVTALHMRTGASGGEDDSLEADLCIAVVSKL